MEDYQIIKKLPANTKGKDYVIGDLHGCLHLLSPLLDHVHFDVSKDRLFSVGDLIDRGPYSLPCLHLLNEPWFHAVQGNHELMMIDFFSDYLMKAKINSLHDTKGIGFLECGGDWVKAYYEPEQNRMSVDFNQGLILALNMPMIIVVGEGEERFNIIHAELIRPDYRVHQNSGDAVWHDKDIDAWYDTQVIPNGVQDRLVWSRIIMEEHVHTLRGIETCEGLSKTFCGHTYRDGIRQKLSHICLDTGAFISLYTELGMSKDHHLTMLDVKENRWCATRHGDEKVFEGNL